MPAFPTYTGINAILSGRMTYNAHGVAPSAASITFPPQAVTRAVGTLQFVDPDTGTTIEFRNCLLDSVTVRGGGTSPTVLVGRVLDERWAWRNHQIRGAYNLRLPNGEIDKKTEKKPRELATLLLRAIPSITSFDVSALPNDSSPEVIWDYATAADELQRLVSQLGCRVVRELTGRVVIARLGEGKSLPSAPNLQLDYSLDPANLPAKVKLVAAPTEWEKEYELEAVAEEHPGGKYVALDSVSYRPANGWEEEDPDGLWSLEEEDNPVTTPTDRDLGTASVFRAYRIKSDNEFPLNASFEDILPISGQTLETEEDTTGITRRVPAAVRGVYYDDRVTFENTGENTIVDATFSILADKGIIVFSRPVYQLSDAGEYLPAQLKLTCSHGVRDKLLRVPVREAWEQSVPGAASFAGTRVIMHNEFNLQYRGTGDNRGDVSQQARYYLDAELRSLITVQASSIQTPGIVGVQPDGAIQQLSWSCGGTAPTVTTISRNTESDPYTLPYEVRQRVIQDQQEALQILLEERRKKFASGKAKGGTE